MLSPQQIECLAQMLKGDKTDKAIAKSINVTPKTICDWKKNKEFQDEYNSLMRNKLQFAAAAAFSTQKRLLKSKNDMVAHLAAKDLMDRAGFAPTDKVEQTVDMELNITVDYGEDAE